MKGPLGYPWLYRSVVLDRAVDLVKYIFNILRSRIWDEIRIRALYITDFVVSMDVF
eukprot:m.172019 g.172019  ORF g.172019 m.172019 type:complete len:56 (+) comp16510_c1_seq2:144-311(+)